MISIGQQNSSAGPSQIKNSAKHSKKLPYWLWFIIAKSLGIKLHPNDKPLVSVVLHGITLFSGGIMLLTRIWFSGNTNTVRPCLHSAENQALKNMHSAAF